MQVRPINYNQQNNLTFNARLDIYGCTAKGAGRLTNLLPEGSIEKLQAKAKTFGTEEDVIHICVYPHQERNIRYKKCAIDPNLIQEADSSEECYTKTAVNYIFPSIRESKFQLDSDSFKYFPWKKGLKKGFLGVWLKTQTPDREPVYEWLSKALDELKTKFDKNV